MSADAGKVELERLAATARRLFGARPGKLKSDERAEIVRVARDPEEQSKRYKIKDGRVRQVK